jgi:glycyl-tRNA synthetase
MKKQNVDALVNLAARRAIILPAFNIYGDIGGFYDYGPLGFRIKNNIVGEWRRTFIESLGNLEVETTLISPAVVFEASGHLKNFADPIITCKKCSKSHRADKLLEELYQKRNDLEKLSGIKKMDFKEMGAAVEAEKIKCDSCGDPLKAEVKSFNLMMGTKIGPTGDLQAYMRPETAQGIFMDFKAIHRTGGMKLPIAIGQIGKVFRNEISPRKILIRMREFTQMELEYFFDPSEKDFQINNRKPDMGKALGTKLNFLSSELQASGKAEYEHISLKECVTKGYIPNEFMAYMLSIEVGFLERLGFKQEDIRFRQIVKEELPHYSLGNIDVEARLDSGFEEIIGNAYRTDFDLKNHEKYSKGDMSIVNGEKKLVPHVVELSFGLDRIFWTLLANSLYADEKRGWEVLDLNRASAPYAYVVLPLQKDDRLEEKALSTSDALSKKGIQNYYASSGSIGKRYARADESGIPYAITVDYQTLEDGTITVRDRGTAEQTRKSIDEIS